MYTLRQCGASKLWHSSRSLIGALVIAAVFLGLAAENLAAAASSLFFPHLISGMGFDTRLVLDNPSGSPATMTLTARADDGTLLSGTGVQNPATVTIAPYQQVSVDAGQLFGLSPDVLTLGWIQGDSNNSQVTASLYVATSGQQDGAGIQVGSALQTSVAGAIPSGLQTALALVNPNASAANVTMQLFDAGGTLRGQTTFSIPAQGHRAQFLNDGSAATASSVEGGHFEISSDAGLGGLEVMTGVSGYTLSPVAAPTAGPFIFPQVASGPDVSTSLLLQNTSGVAVQVRWSAWNSQGQAFQASDTSPVSLTIPAHGSFSGTVSSIFGAANTANFNGTIQAALVPVSGAIQPALAAGLSLYTQGSAISSLSAQIPTSGIFLLGQDPAAPSGTTSFEVLNPGASNAQITLLYYGANGNALGNLSATLPPHQPLVMNPGSTSQVPAGTTLVLMRATAGVVGYQLQTDSTGLWQVMGGTPLPAQIGGAAPLSAALGGLVESSDARASVNVPLGALSSNTAVTITSLSGSSVPPAPNGMVVVAAFQVSPMGMQFSQPVTLTFPVLDAVALPNPTYLQIYTPSSGVYQATNTTVSSGLGGTTLTATLSAFPPGSTGTTLVVLAPAPSGGTPTPVLIGAGGGGLVGGGGGGGTPVPAGGSGGVVTSSDGQVSVVIPPGALPGTTTVAVSTVSTTSLPAPGNSQSVLLAMDAEPSGITFSTPVTLRFNVPSQLQGRLPSQLPLEVYNPLNGQYQSTGTQAVLSADGTTLTASVTHFTVFVILQPFTPFASPIIPSGTLVSAVGIVSVMIPAAVIPPIPPPVISSFTPTSGASGTTVTISGSGFTGASAVTFSGTPAAAFSVLSDGSITAVVPAGAATGIICVTAPGGSATTSALTPAVFTVTSGSGSLAPTIASFTPASGPAGTTVTITGGNFIGAASVMFGPFPANFLVNSVSQIVATVPAGAPLGPVAVSVTNSAGTATAGTSFTVMPPTGTPPVITSFNPAGGAAGINVNIVGTGFTGVTGVTLAGAPMAFTFNSDTSIAATVPAGGTSGLIGVTTLGGTAFSSADFNVTGTINGTDSFNLVSTTTGTLITSANVTFVNPLGAAAGASAGTLLPVAALTVLNPASVTGLSKSGTLLPSAALTVLNPASVTGLSKSGTLLPSAALTVLNPLSVIGSPKAGTLLPMAALTVANYASGTSMGLTGTAVTIKGAGFWDGQTLPTLGPNGNISAVTIAGVVANCFTVTDDNTIVAITNPTSFPSPGPIVVYKSSVTGDSIGTGNGSITIYSYTASQSPIVPGTFKVFVSGVLVGFDNGSGAMIGSGISSGSINYSTGAVSVTLASAPANTAAITANYATTTGAVTLPGNFTLGPGSSPIPACGIITTAAGNGTAGYSGDTGAATSAELYQALGLGMDSSGNLYIADANNNRIREVAIPDGGAIYTVAGNGTAGFSGDGGSPTSAELHGPEGVALAGGNLYIADTGNNRVREAFLSAETVTIATVAGNGTAGFSGDNGPATSAEFNNPTGVAVDSSGNIFIADRYNDRIRMVSSEAGFPGQNGITVASPASAALNVSATYSAGLTQSGTTSAVITVTNYGGAATSGTITLGDTLSSGLTATAINGTGWTCTLATLTCTRSDVLAAGASYPAVTVSESMASNASGSQSNFASANCSCTGSVFVLLADSVPAASTVLGPPFAMGFYTPPPLNPYTGTPFGPVYLELTDANGNRTSSTASVTLAASAGSLTCTANPVTAVAGVATFSGCKFGAAGSGISLTASFSPVITTVAGNGTAGYSGDGVAGGATSAELNQPIGIWVDASDNLYIGDYQNCRVRKVTNPRQLTGTITTVAGNGTCGFSGDNGPATSAELDGAIGVTFDAFGNMFIADYGANRIRRVGAGGIITTVAGNGTAGYSGDGGAAINAKLNQPWGVVLDSSENLYIGDNTNNRVREVLAANTPASATVLSIIGGNNQTGTRAAALPIPFTVQVTDGNGIPVGGVAVTFTVGTGGGSVSGGAAGATTVTATTNAEGLVFTTLTLGPTAGTNTVTATAGFTDFSMTFTATGD